MAGFVWLVDADGNPINSGNPLPVSPVASGVDQDVNIAAIAGVATPVGNGLAATALRVALPTDGTGVVILGAGVAAIGNIAGQVGAGVTVAGNPVVGGFVARATNLAAVTSNQVQRPISTLNGIQVTKPYAIPELEWQYFPPVGGILNTTTAVTIKAAHASERNYITSLQIMSEALGATTEFAIRDGAGGAVLWKVKIPATGFIYGGIAAVFPVPIKGTAATLLEIVTLTASVTGAVYFNAQGFTGL